MKFKPADEVAMDLDIALDRYKTRMLSGSHSTPKPEKTFRFAIETAISDMVADRLLAPSFEKAWCYIRPRLQAVDLSRQDLIRVKARMRSELWRLHVELELKVGPAAQLQQWAYELERCA